MSARAAPRGARPGVVLVAVVVALLLLAMALAGILAVATHEALLGRVEAATLRARLGAEGAARAALDGWRMDVLGPLVPGQSAEAAWAAGTGAGGVHRWAVVERLSPARWRVSGHAVVGPDHAPVATGRASLLVATASPEGLWSGLAAALTADGAVRLSGTALLDGVAWPGEACGADAVEVDLAGGGGPFPAVRLGTAGTLEAGPDATVQGGMAVDAHVTAARLAAGLGPLGIDALSAVADRMETGAVLLGPVAAGAECVVDAPGNWGAPLESGHPCAGRVPVVFAPGSLDIVGGAGAAFLVVVGDLTVRSGVELHAIVIVLGALVVEEGAVLRGAVRQAGAHAEVAGTIVRDACVLAGAVRRSALDARPFRPAGRWWLPAF